MSRTRARIRRMGGFLLVILVGVYLALCVLGRLLYPRLLFPAPQLPDTPPLPEGGSLTRLPQPDGSHTVVLHWPAPPTGRTVVVFHGNGETIFDNVEYAVELRRHGLGVLLVEYRGYGLTYGPPPSEPMLYEDGEAAIAYLKNLNVSRDRLALWGYSLGSGVAAEMARRGHASSLVLLAPFTSVVDMGRLVAPILPVSLLLAHRLDTLSKASEMRLPTLVIHGDADELIPFAMGTKVASHVPGARLVRVEGGHHADLLAVGTLAKPSRQELFDVIASHLAR